MRVSLNWLRELTQLPLEADEAARKLTLAGLEVEGVHRYGDFTGVIAVEIRALRPHPEAQKLRLVTVWDGETSVEVVCGAPEIPAPGTLVAWARPGARLPSGITVEEKAVRGIVSPGMLCAEDELGLSESHDGLLSLDRQSGLGAGDDVARAFALPDTIFELNVTPNRPDALGHVGVARELCALYAAPFTPPRVAVLPTVSAATEGLDVVAPLDAAGSQRYCAARIAGLKVGPSPTSVRLRLLSLGVRAISNLVDATNLVMLEWSQPLHAFDADTLASAVAVRRATDGETLKTLDGADRVLITSDWVIADQQKAVALAGVMGGLATEVTAKTTSILLECAHFDPRAIRKTARRLGLPSEASQRFERGVDVEETARVAARAATLLVELGGGEIVGPIVDRIADGGLPARRTITLRAERTSRVLGMVVPAAEQRAMLERLHLLVSGDDPMTVTVPAHRPDLVREIDLIEEIARLHGYDHLPSTLPALRQVPPRPDRLAVDRVREVMQTGGLHETINYAFGSPELFAPFATRSGLVLHNPLRAELSELRALVVPGLVAACRRNQAAGVSDVRLFELGTTFAADPARETGAAERTHLGVLMAGSRAGWLRPSGAADALDAFDLLGVIDVLGKGFGIRLDRVPTDCRWLHPGVRAALQVGATTVGLVGELHPDVCRKLDVAGPVFVAELDLVALGAPHTASYAELPRFPAVSRDLSFFIDASVSALTLESLVAKVRPALQASARVLDDYRDPKYVPAGKKGMLWSFTYRAADRTLTDAEVDDAHRRFVVDLQSALAPTTIELR